MGFWSDYRKSLKPLTVEEPIDVWVHRPLGYVLAKASYPLPFVSPNLLTLISILLGLGTGALLLIDDVPWHMQLAALALFSATIFDCSDGQLARMRGTSSAFGRMLDGCADIVVTLGAVVPGGYLVWRQWSDPWWAGVVAVIIVAATVLTGAFHTQAYDYYKNLYVSMTEPKRAEGETYATAEARYHRQKAAGELGFIGRITFPVYLFQIKGQRDVVSGQDPFLGDLAQVPEYSPEVSEIFVRNNAGVMRIWRGWFGFGSLMFGLAVAFLFNVLDWYIVLRVVGLNALYYGYLLPAQRRASKRTVDEIAVLAEARAAASP
jgi:phosphatidylglycerophosphate synthase